MVSGDKHQLLGIGSMLDHLFQRLVWPELVVVAADKELGLRTLAEERKRIDTAIGRDGSSQRYQGAHVRIGTASVQSGHSAEGETGEDDRQPELALQPCQRCLHVGDLATSLIVLASAQSRPTEVEPQNWKAEGVQRLHGMEDDFVVHRPAKHGMRMADESRVRRRRRTNV